MSNWSYNPAVLLAAAFVLFAACCWVKLPVKDTQLFAAVRQNNTNAIQALVAKGANVNCPGPRIAGPPRS
jgi:hypothetical protein